MATLEGLRFAVALLLLVFGAGFALRFRGIPLRGAFRRAPDGGAGALSPGAALSSALCGTLGVGTVLSAVSALTEGGPGALLPLLLGTLTGASLKYAEIALTLRLRKPGLPGPLAPLAACSPHLARLYALLLLPVSLLGMGNLAQVQALSSALTQGIGLPRPLLALAVPLLLLPLCKGGIARIGRAASLCLPVAALLYVAACALGLWRLRAALPAALGAVLEGGLRFRPELLALGVARGLFLCEAGLGTSAFAHGQSRAEARTQGALGAWEALLATGLCLLAALLLLCSGVPLAGDASGAALAAFRAALGPAGGALLCGMLAFFALSTLPLWWFYGRACARFLLPFRLTGPVYTLLFLLLSGLGCLFPFAGVWRLADACNLLLALPNLAMLFLLRHKVSPPAEKKIFPQ